MKNKIALILLLLVVLRFSISARANESSKMLTIRAGRTSAKNGDISLEYDIKSLSMK